MDAATRAYLHDGAAPHILCDPMSGQRITLAPMAREVRSSMVDGLAERLAGWYWLDVVGFAGRLPDHEQWWQNLLFFVQELAGEVQAPVVFPRPFQAYADATGPHAGRLTSEQWATVAGVVGLQHLPKVQGGEPGDLGRLVELAAETGTAEGTPEWRAQKAAAETGFYTGAIDGDVGDMTAAAVEAMAEDHSQLSAVTADQRDQIGDLALRVKALQADEERMGQAAAAFAQLADLLYPEWAARAQG